MLYNFIDLFRLESGDPKLPDLATDLEDAWRDWKHARAYFNNVTDPDLIDYAIYYMGATEKKYIYLLKRAREIGISIEGFKYRMNSRHG
ncbi:MAG TPA: DUF2508 domain-containing protein [Firmicutes bacterium]|nr:DUF2508 domain-containing protein [Bacillota bacterium]